MKYFAIISLLLFCASCGQKKERVVDLTDEIPTSNRNYDDPDTTDFSDPIATKLAIFQSWNAKVKSINILERRSFLERFRPLRTEKFVWFFEDGDSMEYERMVFRDSIHTKSAFYNWLDRSGTSYFGANESIQKNPFALMYADTVILRLSGAIDFNFWETHIEDNEWLAENDYWITQRKYGKAHWFVLREDELKDETEP